MADPLSIARSTVGIAGVALQCISILTKDLKAIKDAPQAISDLDAELSAIKTVLQTLRSELSDSPNAIISSDVQTRLQVAITNCA